MLQQSERSLGWVFMSRMIAFICFLIIVVLAKILENFTTPGGIYQRAAEGLLFSNFWLLVLIMIILFVGDLLMALPFPVNLPGPIARAFGSAFCVAFILNVFQWVDSINGTNLYQIVWLLSFVLLPLIFFIVLVSGYLEIMKNLFRPQRTEENANVVVHPEHPRAAESNTEEKSWDDVGAELRLMLYDIFHRLRQEVIKKP